MEKRNVQVPNKGTEERLTNLLKTSPTFAILAALQLLDEETQGFVNHIADESTEIREDFNDIGKRFILSNLPWSDFLVKEEKFFFEVFHGLKNNLQAVDQDNRGEAI